MGNIKSITPINDGQTYDLEVDHPDHQFYLSNGILTSNSHAVLYSMISFQTAYLKAHYPVEFLLANLSQELKTNKQTRDENVEKIKQEIRSKNVKILPPNVNTSLINYHMKSDNELLTGFDAIKSLGDSAIQDIISKRPFKSFNDFMLRIDPSLVKANSIKALAACGALDDFKLPRSFMYLYCSDYREKLRIWQKKKIQKQFSYPEDVVKEWNLNDKFAIECKFIGEAFCCRPYKVYGNFFSGNNLTLNRIKNMPEKTKIPSFKGIIKDFFEFKVKKKESKNFGQSMAKMTLEDVEGNLVSCTIFTDKLVEARKRMSSFKKGMDFTKNLAINVACFVNMYDDEMNLIIDTLYQVATPPEVPSKANLASRKINMRIAKEDTLLNKCDIEDNIKEDEDNIEEDIEDVLYSKGHINLDEDE